jgi:hypothetical protein
LQSEISKPLHPETPENLKLYQYPSTMPLSSVSKTRRKEKTKKRTSKIIDRLTYSPKKHKQKITKQLRKSLQARDPATPHPPPSTPSLIKFGSININGLDLEASWAVEQLLSKRGFDVSNLSIKLSE